MDRVLVYPGQSPMETDTLYSQRNVMIALSKMFAIMIGNNGIMNNCPCVPGTGLTVTFGPGEILQSANIDDTVYSSLPIDTTHQIIKQGILLDTITLSVPAPITAGQSIAYLVQCKFLEVDNAPISLPYYNSATPTIPFPGPNGSGTSQPTRRSGTLIVNVKAGTAAASGSQVIPTPDAGYVGAWVVTIANGAASVVTGNIAYYDVLKFIGADLLTQIRYVNRPARLFINQL